MDDKTLIQALMKYSDIIEMSDIEKNQFIKSLSFFKNKTITEIGSSAFESLKNSIRGKLIIKKGSCFSMLYGDTAFLSSGALYMYSKEDTIEKMNKETEDKQEENIRVTCLLNSKIYNQTDVIVIPNNSYIKSLQENLSYHEFLVKSKKEKEGANSFAKASQDSELIIFNLQEIINIKCVSDALTYYLLEFAQFYPKFAAIGAMIRKEKSLSPLYDSFPGLAGEYTLEVLRQFFDIPYGTWRRYL